MANNASTLSTAVNRKRTDIVRLLLDRGVPVNVVWFETVCYSADPELIELFLDRDANPIAGYPLYRGFQNCLKPIISVYRAIIIQAMPSRAPGEYRRAAEVIEESFAKAVGKRIEDIVRVANKMRKGSSCDAVADRQYSLKTVLDRFR
jgi:hypothetical protein